MTSFLLEPDNFTPLARTPWAGCEIARYYKPMVKEPDIRIGESWEFSICSEMPSRIAGTRQFLADYLQDQAATALGRETRLGRRNTGLLVKLLDAAEPLSVQIHPSDDYYGLKKGESGKPESWYVLRTKPDAHILLGFKPGTTRTDLEAARKDSKEFVSLMHTIKTRPGDVFVIPPGTPHAIGAGITLLEPQRVLPGRSGVTYRFWDWNRRYNDQGLSDPHGQPRHLNWEDAIAVTEWQSQDNAWLSQIYRPFGDADLDTRARAQTLIDREPYSGSSALRSETLRVVRLEGSGALSLPPLDSVCSLSVLDGEIEISDGLSQTLISQGNTACTLAGSRLCLKLNRAHAILAAVY